MSYNVENGFKQAGGKANAPFINNVNTSTQVTFTQEDGASANVADVQFEIQDAEGNAITFPTIVNVWLSDAATGVGLTSTAASGTVAVDSVGTLFGTLEAKKALVIQTTAAGLGRIAITDTGNTGYYVCVQCPFSGQTFVSDEITSYAA